MHIEGRISDENCIAEESHDYDVEGNGEGRHCS